mmetsp:Transcript_12494/g.50017  ORF Transcript_12494/g.50017 Transcript_12494/m.50017 type:complete len:241 (-) Transcript_12494:1078-1800(-)
MVLHLEDNLLGQGMLHLLQLAGGDLVVLLLQQLQRLLLHALLFLHVLHLLLARPRLASRCVRGDTSERRTRQSVGHLWVLEECIRRAELRQRTVPPVPRRRLWRFERLYRSPRPDVCRRFHNGTGVGVTWRSGTGGLLCSSGVVTVCISGRSFGLCNLSLGARELPLLLGRRLALGRNVASRRQCQCAVRRRGGGVRDGALPVRRDDKGSLFACVTRKILLDAARQSHLAPTRSLVPTRP